MNNIQNAIDLCLNYSLKINDRVKKKKKRLKDYLKKEIEKKHKIYFVTFTFKNEFVSFTKKIRREFTDYLSKENGLSGRLFFELGNETNRLHLHGFISTDRYFSSSNKQSNLEKFGWTKFERVDTKEDLNRTIGYITNYFVYNDMLSIRPIVLKPKIRL